MKKIILPVTISALIILLGLSGYEGYIIYKQNKTIIGSKQQIVQPEKQEQKIDANNTEEKTITTPDTTLINFDKEKPLPADTISSFPGDGYIKKLNNGLEVNVAITDKENNKAELKFSNQGDLSLFRGSEYQTYTFEDVNSLWFNFSFVALGTDEIYFKDSSGHEGIPQHYIAKGHNLINLGELIKGILIDKFPKERFPQIGLTFYPSFIRVEEENYCCDTLYDTSNPEREKYRKVFFLDRKTFSVLKEDKMARR